MSTPDPAVPDDITVKPSPHSVAETVETLGQLIAERGMTLFAVIDQQAEAGRAGLDLRETVLILFGNPRGGTPVMDAAPLAALDLPLKVLVYDDAGQTRIAYLRPSALAARYGLEPTLAAPLAGIDQLTDAAML